MTVLTLKDIVDKASKVISHYWPMTTFVHHNPIRSLENFPFYEAVEIANHFIGGHGYLANEEYRKFVRDGRIRPQDVDSAIKAFAKDKELEFASQKLSHFEVLRAHLLEGISSPCEGVITKLVETSANAQKLFSLAERLTMLEQNTETENLACDFSLSAWCDQEFDTQLVFRINDELIKWCKSFMDEGDATWAMPEREKGFYAAWKSLASQEWSVWGIKDSATRVKDLPDDPEQALLEQLDALAIPQELRQDYLSFQLTSLYGWASYINWRAENKDYLWQAAYPIDLIQYLAVRLYYERQFVDKACKKKLGINANYNEIANYIKNKEALSTSDKETKALANAWRLTKLADALDISQEKLAQAPLDKLEELLTWLDEFPETKHGMVWVNAYEARYQEELIEKLQRSISKIPVKEIVKPRPLAQLMFCIDVRSEAFRRNLEAVGEYETIGFAGFFGLAISSCALDHKHETDQCPAILKPAYRVHEVVRAGQEHRQAKHDSGRTLLQTLHAVFADLKYQVLSPYIMVEALGWLFGVQILERTIFPGIYPRWRKWFNNLLSPKLATKMTLDKDELDRGLTQDEQNTSAEGILKTMGLTENFARLVVVAGHTSQSDNNPYEAALNCGACGGNSGEPNARLLASLLNKPELRDYLAQKGIIIPGDTHFMAAVHNTTTDVLDFYELEDLPDSHREDFENLQADLKQAAIRTNLERCAKLPGAGESLSSQAAVQEITRRSADWSETRPEWGLSGNASFIIGRRELTKDINLEGRTFLNSHDYRLDPTGALLEGILMGPMVVGQWINAEHYFSATDTEVYGSGSKVYHNVVGRLGIMSGPQSDLRTGLPWQSMANGDMTYHEPLRLFVVVEAPRARILEIVERQPVLKQLLDNEWIRMMAIDHDSKEKLHIYKAEQGWIDIF